MGHGLIASVGFVRASEATRLLGPEGMMQPLWARLICSGSLRRRPYRLARKHYRSFHPRAHQSRSDAREFVISRMTSAKEAPV